MDYETYIAKNKSILHNDPQREMLTFPYDDIVIPVCQICSFFLGKKWQRKNAIFGTGHWKCKHWRHSEKYWENLLTCNHFSCFNLFPIHFLFFTKNRPGNGLLVQLYIYSDVCPFQEVINLEILINSVGNKYITLFFFLKQMRPFKSRKLR